MRPQKTRPVAPSERRHRDTVVGRTPKRTVAKGGAGRFAWGIAGIDDVETHEPDAGDPMYQ